MLFTTKTEYGLKALGILAKNGKNDAISLAEIAKQTDLSLSYLEQLFSKLKKAKIIKSTKGAEGGYFLARSAGDVSLLEIIQSLEGKTAVNSCMAGGKQSCSGNCLTRKIWVEIQDDIEQTLKKYTLKNLI
ncbi:MAG: Rrf2 family transcriptional regulator [Candidatus Buchananbacteria bacterium]|jgi:Rrf2 family protein